MAHGVKGKHIQPHIILLYYLLRALCTMNLMHLFCVHLQARSQRRRLVEGEVGRCLLVGSKNAIE